MSNGIATILKTVEKLRGRDKLEFLEQVRDNATLKEVVRAALDPYLSYPITMHDCPPLGDDPTDEELQAMHEVLESMNLGVFTPVEAEAAVENLIEDYPRLTPILYRILAKNLRCGIGVATAKKVWEGLIPDFEIAEIGTEISHYEFPFAIEYNFVGTRLFGVMSDGLVSIFNKKGRVVNRLGVLRFELDQLAEELEEDYVFEGILVSNGVPVSRKAISDHNAVFHLTDMVPTAVWKSREVSDSFEFRVEDLRELVERYRELYPEGMLRKAETFIVEKERHLHEYYLDALNHGCEGLILKELGAPYEFGGATTMNRWHPTEVLELPVVEVHGEDRLGGLKVSYQGQRYNVRHGFAPDEREDLWKDQEKILGKKVRVLVQPGEALRFIRYLGVVDDS